MSKEIEELEKKLKLKKELAAMEGDKQPQDFTQPVVQPAPQQNAQEVVIKGVHYIPKKLCAVEVVKYIKKEMWVGIIGLVGIILSVGTTMVHNALGGIVTAIFAGVVAVLVALDVKRMKKIEVDYGLVYVQPR